MPDTGESSGYPQMKAKSGLWLSIADPGDFFRFRWARFGGAVESTREADRREQSVSSPYDALDEGDIILADRYSSGWSDVCLAAWRASTSSCASTKAAPRTFATGKRLGKNDHLFSGRDRNDEMDVGKYAHAEE